MDRGPNLTLGEVAELVGGELHGDGALVVHGAATLRDAGPGELTLVDSVVALKLLQHSPAAAVITAASVQPTTHPYVACAHAHAAFAAVVGRFRPPRSPAPIGISPGAVVARTAQLGDAVTVMHGAVIGEDVEIGDRVVIHPGVVIEAGCRIGDDSVLFPRVTLYENTIVGPRGVIHAGAVIGAYGFGYELVEGRYERTAQLGYVQIGADVEIGAGTTIDRGTYGPTRIGEGTKIDNQVMIAHNCRIGRHNVICSQVGIAGSSSTGDYVVLAGQVGIRDHVHVGDRAVLGAKAGLMNNVPDGQMWFGAPARPKKEQKQIHIAERRLPEMRKQLKDLERKLQQLVAASSGTAGDDGDDGDDGDSSAAREAA